MSKNKSYKTVDVNMDDNTFLLIAKKAHELDVTFNAMCCRILENRIKEVTKGKQKSTD